MSIVYSHISGKHIDTDSCEAVELSDGDIVASNDDDHLMLAYDMGLLTRDEMINLGFEEEELR